MSGRFYLELRKLWKGRLFQNFSNEIFLVLVGQCPWSSDKFLSVPLICYLVPICSGCIKVPGHFAERHFAERYFAERTFCRRTFRQTDILQNGILTNGLFAEKTFCRTHNLPKIEMLFRQNIKHPRSPILFIKLFGTVTQLSCESLTVHNHIDSLFVQRVTHLLGTCCDVR
jgi:hypothetical protein